MMDSANAFSRFLLPTWPLLALLAGIAIAAAGRGKVLADVATAAVAAVVLSLSLPAVVRFASGYADCKQAVRQDMAAWLYANTPPGGVFSISDAGLVPARAGRRVVDQMMLNDPALQRGDPWSVGRKVGHVYGERPLVLVLAGRAADHFAPRYVLDGTIAGDPRFGAYALAHVADARCGYTLWAFRRSRPLVTRTGARRAPSR
jgi:arabinofuranosyltransferase